MTSSILKLILSALLLMAWSPVVFSQTFPVQSTGIFTVSDGNELRILQTLPSTKIQGIYATSKKEKLADFSGSYDKETGKVLAKMTFCDGKRAELTSYFTRNNADALEIYFGSVPNDQKETGTRKGRTRPTLAFDCVKDSAKKGNEPYLGKGSWTGTWKTNLGMIRLIQINDIVTGKVFVIGDYKENGVIQLIDFSGNDVEGEITTSTRGEAYFKIARANETTFDGTYRWGLQTERTPWGGVRIDGKLPLLTSTGAKLFVNRLLTEY
jgi:hypothetical protein